MRAHELAHIERREPREQAAPDDRHQRGRDQQLRKARQRIGSELAPLDRQLQSCPQHRHHVRDHLAVVELSELGEAGSLRHDQPQDVLARRAEDLGHERIRDHLHHGPDGQRGERRCLDLPHDRAHHGAHELLEQALLVGEVEIDGALGDAGARRHVVEPRGRKSIRGEFLERRRENRLAARVATVVLALVALPGIGGALARSHSASPVAAVIVVVAPDHVALD